MANIAVNRVTNANVYANGRNLLGRAESIDLPDVKMKMAEHKAIGMIGSIELPSGVEKLEMKIKWNAIYADVAVLFGDPYKAVQIQVRSNIETYDSNGRSAQAPLVIFATATSKNFPQGNFKQHDNVEVETTLNVTAVKQIIGGVTVMEYDALANIHRVNGVDVNATYRANTGA